MRDCPTPGRPIYATEGAAWNHVRTHGAGRLLPYRCVTGHWHVALAAEARLKRAPGRLT